MKRSHVPFSLLVFAMLIAVGMALSGCGDQKPAPAPKPAAPAPVVKAVPLAEGQFSNAPTTRSGGGKWRIGYYEGGEYITYQNNFMATVRGLMDLGWIENRPIPVQQGEQTADLWKWLGTEVKSDFIEFVADGHYSAAWDKNRRKELSEQIIKRLSERKDIDLIIAMGTWAGQDLGKDLHQVPTIVMSTSDPLSAGIIRSVEDSGSDHLHARVDPYRYERQIRIFHDIIGFNRLGVAYENTEAGKSYAAIDQVMRVSAELGFEVVSCYAKSDTADKAEAEREVLRCFKDLVQKADAIYVARHGGINKRTLPQLAAVANAAKIPTFSQSGSDEVKQGLLLSISTAGFKYVGKFYAQTIAKIFNGAKPRELDQVFEDPPKIAINLKTCELIGFDPPVDVLGAADEIFQQIENP